MNGLFRSLVFRTIAASSLLAVAGLIVIATVIAALYRQSAQDNFARLLSAHLFNLIGTVGVAPDGALVGAPELGDLRFTIPKSGWYWSVEIVAGDSAAPLRSPSLTGDIPALPVSAAPFDAEFRRSYAMAGLAGEQVEIVESEFVIDDADRVARFRVMGNRSELAREIATFERTLRLWLALFGVLTIAVNALAIYLGLRPLGHVRQALADVREGRAERLDGVFPSEIAPLAAETNKLIESNHRIVERARTQVGNLAHSLKTPLAVVTNEGRALGGEKGRLIADQAEAMRMQVDHYLKRARIAAQKDSVAFRTPVRPSLERFVRVMGKLHPHLDFSLTIEGRDPVFSGEREDFDEVVGNLIENAAKWARSRVSVTAADMARSGASGMTIAIEDDGPGIPEDKAREAIRRGNRLDESKPGTGLGLAIVVDLVEEYGGALVLGQSSLGGLKAEVIMQNRR